MHFECIAILSDSVKDWNGNFAWSHKVKHEITLNEPILCIEWDLKTTAMSLLSSGMVV